MTNKKQQDENKYKAKYHIQNFDPKFLELVDAMAEHMRETRKVEKYAVDEDVDYPSNDFFEHRSETNKLNQEKIKKDKEEHDYFEKNKYKLGVHIETPNLQKTTNQVEFHPSLMQEPFKMVTGKRAEENKLKDRFKQRDPEINNNKTIEIDYRRIRTPM